MNAWQAIQKTVDYIEDNIKEVYSIEKLASISNLSMFYFQRLFSKLVGKSVNEYIKLRKVARAKEDLKNSGNRILDVAIDFGFNSHETFTRAFKDTYKITPDEYRKRDIVLNDFLKPQLAINYTIVDKNVPLLVDDMIIEIRHEKLLEVEHFTGFFEIIDASEMQKIGENNLVKLWHKFNEERNNMKNLVTPGYAMECFASTDEKGKVAYFIGGLSQKNQDANYDEKLIEPGAYIVCSFEAENFEYLVNDALYKANKYFFEIWLPNEEIQMQDMEPFLYQKYFDVDSNPRIEIWIKPIKKGTSR